MATRVHSAPVLDAAERTRTLLLVWQDPRTRAFVRVGRLRHLVNGGYEFSYLASASEQPDFNPLVEFPELDKVYKTSRLPAFFSNRVLSSERASFDEHMKWIGLDPSDADLPFEFLARTGGARATDTFHVVEEPPVGAGVLARFFVSGVRYCDPNGTLVGQLSAGTELALRPEPDNKHNPRALLIDVAHDKPIGYVPDWMVGDVHEKKALGNELRTIVEQVNTDAPHHLRVLCRIETLG